MHKSKNKEDNATFRAMRNAAAGVVGDHLS